MNTSNAVRPEIGAWYARTDRGETFQVVDYDEAAGLIETQSFDGDIDEIDEDSWDTLPLESCAPPEDWTGPVDDVQTDDLGYSDTEMAPQDWNRPLQPAGMQADILEDLLAEEEDQGVLRV